jgi:beta-1,4-mannosyltransferase
MSKSILGLPGPQHGRFNPYQSLLYGEMEKLGWSVDDYRFRWIPRRASLVHLHWPEAKWNASSLWQSLMRGILFLNECEVWRRTGCKIVWTAHNYEAHDAKRTWLSGFFWRRLHKKCDGVVFLSQSSIPRLMDVHKGLERLPHVVIEHGDYKKILNPPFDRLAARREIGLVGNGSVVGFVGQIKAYKGVDRLITAFRDLRDPELSLLIAGKPDGSKAISRVLEDAQRTANCIVHDGFISPARLQRMVEACDLLVFPYSEILNSGSVIYALSAGRPVLVPDVPVFRELSQYVSVTGCIHTFSGQFDAGALRSALSSNCDFTGPADIQLPSWQDIAARHAAFFERVAA